MPSAKRSTKTKARGAVETDKQRSLFDDAHETPPPPKSSGDMSSTDTQEAATNEHTSNGSSKNGSNGSTRKKKGKRRATAQSMAAGQRSISVSEFFAKNRHLLGFDNPRKALLTTVKEAVDNSLDACEEAGITPEIWVHIEATGNKDRFKIGVQDNGPGIVKKQIPLIFGKLLYGSKFHRLRMSRGQQGIGISAAGMYGMLTTGKPVKIISKISVRRPAHYYEIRIDTKTNNPEILNGKGDGVDVPPGEKGRKYVEQHGIEWEALYDLEEGEEKPKEVVSGTRVTIELEGRYQRGRGSVDEYLQQTAIANPHVTLHYRDPEDNVRSYRRSTRKLPPEPKEIKPHPYGIELGRLVSMLKDAHGVTLSKFFTESFSRVSPGVAKKICSTAGIGTRTNTNNVSRDEADKLYRSIQETKISAPQTDCISPIGEELLLKGLRHVVPGEFYAAATRPPAVYRGNPFQIEVALAYGGAAIVQKVTREALVELLSESDIGSLRKFLKTTFDGVGDEGAEKIIKASGLGQRKKPSKLDSKEIDKLHGAMHNVNLSEGQSMQVLRYANRVPLQFQHNACAITQSVIGTNWRSYGLSQSRGNLPAGPITVMVHMASVWVPFTSESKEAVASYPEIQKELKLALQGVGRKLGMFLNRRQKVKQEGERRNIFLRYLGEVATAVSDLNETDRDALYNDLVRVAERKTAEADAKFDDRGQRVEVDLADDDSVIIVTNEESSGEEGAAD